MSSKSNSFCPDWKIAKKKAWKVPYSSGLVVPPKYLCYAYLLTQVQGTYGLTVPNPEGYTRQDYSQ